MSPTPPGDRDPVQSTTPPHPPDPSGDAGTTGDAGTLHAASRPRPAAGEETIVPKPSPGGTSLTGNRVVAVEGGYRMIRSIGEGSFGEVWLAEAPGGVEVALKIIRLPVGHETSRLELRALELMKRMRHPFLLQVQAFWAVEQRIVIAMELADCSLSERARRCGNDGRLLLPELLQYMREAAEAIDYLHQESVLHRDVKPENLLVSRGHCKVADFGVARLMDEQGLSVVATRQVGSPLYMAPECWSSEVSPHSDQYSLACSYVELRTGQSPFMGSGLSGVMQRHLKGKPNLESLEPREATAVKRALARDPQRRYPSCAAFVAALVAATQAPTGPALSPRAARFPLAARWAAAGVLTLGVAIASFFAWSEFSQRRAAAFLPAHCVPADDAPRPVLADGKWLYAGIERVLPSGQRIPFRLIPRTTSNDPPNFYLMETEVTRRWFEEFAAARPEQLAADSGWYDQPPAPHLAAEQVAMLPVVNVRVEEAHRFARWIGGRLPTGEEWDKAAGEAPVDAPTAAFRQPRGLRPVATDPRDYSRFGIYDLAGNAKEFTSDGEPQFSSTDSIPLTNPHPLQLIVLRGRSYHDYQSYDGDDSPASLRWPSHSDFEAIEYGDFNDETGFRVLLSDRPAASGD